MVSFARGVPAAVHYISHDKVTEVIVQRWAIQAWLFWRNGAKRAKSNTMTTRTTCSNPISRSIMEFWATEGAPQQP